jgi:hypothetical protein
MVFESTLSHPSKKMESLDWWTYLGWGWSPRSAGRRTTIASPWCRWNTSTSQKIKPTKKVWHANLNSSNPNNRICEDWKLSNLMAPSKERVWIYSHKIWWSLDDDKEGCTPEDAMVSYSLKIGTDQICSFEVDFPARHLAHLAAVRQHGLCGYRI